MRPLAVILLLLGCGKEAPTVQGRSAWATAQAAFDSAFFDVGARAQLFTPDAAGAFVLPSLVDERRYRFLQVAELRRLDATHRSGQVAFAIDGWPTALSVELTRAGPSWVISAVPPKADQQAVLAPTAPDGLVMAQQAAPWAGGLAGRDQVGRPTAAVLVFARDELVWVDGRKLEQNDQASVVRATKQALDDRQRLAKDAHATYRRQVAIALNATASALRHALLAEWAVEAGAEVLSLVVRRPDGGPGELPLAVIKQAPPIGEPVTLNVRQDVAGAHLELHGQTVHVPPRGAVVDPEDFKTALRNLTRNAAPPAGAVVDADADGDHRRVVAVVDALRAVRPDMPVATRRPE